MPNFVLICPDVWISIENTHTHIALYVLEDYFVNDNTYTSGHLHVSIIILLKFSLHVEGVGLPTPALSNQTCLFVSLGRHQCDHLGNFERYLAINFLKIVTEIFGDFLGLF